VADIVLITATSRWIQTAAGVYIKTILRSVFEAEAKAASASPTKVVHTVAVPITRAVVFIILVELCGTELGGSREAEQGLSGRGRRVSGRGRRV